MLKFGLLTDFLAKVKESIKSQTLFFHVEDMELSNLKIDNPNGYDLKWFEDAINSLLKVTVEIINQMLGERGIKLPSIGGVDYSDIEEYAKAGFIEVLVSPIIHIG